MKKLAFTAQIYILATIAVGAGLSAWNLVHEPWIAHGWEILGLGLLASLTLILKVIGATDRSHYNISFLIYAFTFVLLGTPAAMLVILISNLIEWAWHKYTWYIQCFNIGSYLITIQITGWVYQSFNLGLDGFSFYSILAQLSAVTVFTLVNHLLVGIVLWVARGENLAKSGIFDFLPLMIDFTLLSMGTSAALVWQVSPFAVLMTLTPLYLIYSTLRVPALERKTETDPKTGLFNYEHFQKVLDLELVRAQRFSRPLTVVMADMDLLRNINNTYGHLAGDEVLLSIAVLLRGWARPGDTVARFGGEEFAVLMPEIGAQEAYAAVEDLRRRIQDYDFYVSTSVTPLKVSMSFGVAGLDESTLSSKEFVHNADTALYHAKLKGRNRAYIYSPNGYQDFLPNLAVENQAQPNTPEAKPPAVLPTSTNPLPPQPLPELDDDKPAQAAPAAQPRPFWVVNLFIFGLALTALLLFTLLHGETPLTGWIGLAAFAGAVMLTEWLSVDIYVRETAISTSAVPILAGTLLFGPAGALLMSATFAAVAFLKHRSPFSRFIFNWSNQLVAGLTLIGMLTLAGVDYPARSAGMQLLVCLLASIIFYAFTTASVALAMHLDMGVPLRVLWKENFSWLAPYYLIMGVVAFGLTITYQLAGVLGVAVILVPILLLRMTQKQFINRTRDMVNQLREKNRTLETTAQEITRLNNGLLSALAEVIDLHDPYVLGHSSQVTYYAVLVATRLGLPAEQVERIRKASLLHDIGKLGIPDAILRKPAKLTAEEYQVIKSHPILGAEILTASRALEGLMSIVRHHHERFDGSGYPDCLAGSEIPLEARIVALADAVEAMASDRPYRRALDEAAIRSELCENSGTQFDPEIVQIFLNILDEQGVALLVNSGRKPTLKLDRLSTVQRSEVRSTEGRAFSWNP